MRIGFIGLGNMGGPMSLNLLAAGHTLTVYDVRKEAAAEQVAQGARLASTIAEVAGNSDTVITMLPTPRHVEQVLLGDGGLLAAMAEGSTWIDMSTSVPAVADRVRAQAEPLGIRVLDAPVSGMAKGARSGMLQIFVGGDGEDVARQRPALEAMGDPERILHVGPHGAGYAVKLMINLLWFCHLVATSEVLAVGAKAGVDLEVLHRSLVASPATSNFLQSDVLSVLHHGDYDESFAMSLACKDLGLAVDLAREVGVPVELSALVEQVYRRGRAAYGDLAGEMIPMKLYEDVAGLELRLPTSQSAAREVHP
ncbi:3-hydroxyisobutyrate dehydrogenase [Streptomyces spongiicola]|uniref:3-hydroxyisobutyrate dehydrogenase n=1 Tax=Streptomyces spongiicola TaxID=1690221 RepID=A0A388T6G1_9ACTN|nr:NAD(P)-dependent oxidoreductase [Streptomyces spongiicola]GBQ03791.1 3-hydroxyisobutyrate dehydrogenase [Streptomyces spongiicola]